MAVVVVGGVATIYIGLMRRERRRALSGAGRTQRDKEGHGERRLVRMTAIVSEYYETEILMELDCYLVDFFYDIQRRPL